MLKLEHISKNYDRTILNDLQIEFENNKLYVLKGVSGSGKSTLLNIVSGIDREYDGDITYDGIMLNQSDSDFRERYMKQIGYVFQHSLLYAHLTVKENLLFFAQDIERIEAYARTLQVSHLLDQYPTALSGGERQRISIIRALLQNKSILLADEPTASLDAENSEKIACVFSRLKNSGRIVIIATHEDCFDRFADEILFLENGAICKQKGGALSDEETTVITLPCVSAQKPRTLRYVLKKKKSIHKLSLLPLAGMILILLFATALQAVFPREMFRKMTADYPLGVFSAYPYDLERIAEEYPITIYENYQIVDGDVTACALLESKDCVFQKRLACGTIPKRNDELLISQEYAKQKMNQPILRNCLNQTVSFAGRNYKVSGVTGDPESEAFGDAIASNLYYCNTEGIRIYVTYEEAKTHGAIRDLGKTMASLEGLNTDSKITARISALCGGENPSYWGQMVAEMQYTVNMIYAAVLAVITMIGIIGAIFIMNDIRLELHYRRKEFGYLRVFGVSKGRITKIMLYERGFKMVVATVFALLLYFIALLFLKIIYNINGLMPLYSFVGIFVLLLAFAAVSVIPPCRRFLKQNVIELIR